MQLLDTLMSTEQKIFDYFGYVEDWVKIPLDDGREYFWQLFPRYDDKTDPTRITGGYVRFAETMGVLMDSDGDYYENEIYTQRFLPKYVYVGDEFTMISVDTHTDGNKFLMILDNNKQSC